MSMIKLTIAIYNKKLHYLLRNVGGVLLTLQTNTKLSCCHRDTFSKSCEKMSLKPNSSSLASPAMFVEKMLIITQKTPSPQSCMEAEIMHWCCFSANGT